MDLAEFRFDVVDADLNAYQRAFLDRTAQSIRQLQPPALDIDAIEVAVEDGRLWVGLPNRNGPAHWVGAMASPTDAMVVYAHGDHLHFNVESLEEMARFVELILGGRIELKERRGIFLTKVSTYWLITSTIRRRIQTNYYLRPTIRPARAHRYRIDFGVAQGLA